MTLKFIFFIFIGFVLAFGTGYIHKRIIQNRQIISAKETVRSMQKRSPGVFVEVPNFEENAGWPFKYWCVGNWRKSMFNYGLFVTNSLIFAAASFIVYFVIRKLFN